MPDADDACKKADVAFNPVFKGYVILHAGSTAGSTTAAMTPSAIAFIDEADLPDGEQRLCAEVKDALAAAGVELRPYSAISDALGALPRATATTAEAGAEAEAGADSLWIDPAGCSFAIASVVEGLKLVEARSPLQALKAVKSPAELACMQQCHVRDSAALCRFYAWLDRTMVEGTIAVDEVYVDESY